MHPPSTMPSFWDFFYKGELQNKSQHHMYCKACVAHHEQPVSAEGSEASRLIAKKAAHTAACTLATSVSWIVHLIGGGGGIVACPYTFSEAKEYMTIQHADTKAKKRAAPEPMAAMQPPQKKQATLIAYKCNEMLFGASEHAGIQAQALHTVV
ncbi:hypothetical protein B0H10DRAFT_2435184 [Mycena sp. CBHHK59/15]|nr:hypothetical protein B0H10DRAFT_2435184 [Mycena sp. CBHHK59/15]